MQEVRKHHSFHHCNLMLAESFWKLGKIEEGMAILDETLEAMESTGGLFFKEELHRIRGELLLMREPPDEQRAETEFRKAIEVAWYRHAKSFELRAKVSLGRLWKKQEKKKEARAMLSDIYGRFTEGFDTPDLMEARELLHELS